MNRDLTGGQLNVTFTDHICSCAPAAPVRLVIAPPFQAMVSKSIGKVFFEYIFDGWIKP